MVLIGGVLYLVHSGHQRPHYHVFHGEPSDLRSPSGVVREALSGRADAIIELGLLLLILTPIARVVFSVVAFARERDLMYVIMTLVVLTLLLYGLLAG